MAYLLLSVAFAVAVLASPVEERALNCNAVNSIVTIMRAQRVATPYCSSLLSIPTATVTYTRTSTPPCVAVTQTSSSVATITSFASETSYGITTVYPVVPVSVTSTCEISATYIPGPSADANPPARMVKRAPPPGGPPPPPPAGPTPIARPTCLSKFAGPALSSACSCLAITTPTKYASATTTLPAKTITTVIAKTAQVTVYSTVQTTIWTSTYSATQYYTSTFSVLPQPTQTVAPGADPGKIYGVYEGLDFSGQDIQNFYCYAGGPAAPAPYPECTSFDGCVNACAYYNANGLGASSKTTCGAVVYNFPPDGSSGSCYLKSAVLGCGSPNDKTDTGVLLPLIPNDPQ